MDRSCRWIGVRTGIERLLLRWQPGTGPQAARFPGLVRNELAGLNGAGPQTETAHLIFVSQKKKNVSSLMAIKSVKYTVLVQPKESIHFKFSAS